MKKYLFLLLLAVLSAFSTLSLCAQSGYDNGHRYIDLGLPSGTKWADCNVGHSTSTAYGNYFAWGEILAKSNYEWSTYKYGTDNYFLTKYCNDSDYGEDGFTDYKKVLDLSDDVAHFLWGGDWRIPSKEQFKELIEYTKHKWTIINGVNGMLFTGKNGNSIFLPAAGCRAGTSLYDAGSSGEYWSRTLFPDYPYGAYYLLFSSVNLYVYYDALGYPRENGRSVRPVRSKN